VSRVDFLMDGVKVGSDSSAPYSTSYRPSKSLPYGAHTLTAVAYDAAGLSASSAPVSVTRVH